MVTLEQVEQLDRKVKKAVGLIENLRAENSRLTAELSRLGGEKRQLEIQIAETRENNSNLSGAQELLEKGILGAIDQLSSVEEGEKSPLVELPMEEKTVVSTHQEEDEKPKNLYEDEQKPLDIF